MLREFASTQAPGTRLHTKVSTQFRGLHLRSKYARLAARIAILASFLTLGVHLPRWPQDGVLVCLQGGSMNSTSSMAKNRFRVPNAQENPLNRSEAHPHDVAGGIAFEGGGSIGRHSFGQKRAYALLSYGDSKDMLCATLAAALACRTVANDQYDVIIMRLGTPIDEYIVPAGVIQRAVHAPVTSEANGRGKRFGKFWFSEFMDYSSVVFLDHDVLVRKPLLPLFDTAEQLPDTLVAPRAYWITQPYATSGTFALSSGSPSARVHSILSQVLHNRSNEWASTKWLGDMHWLNSAEGIRDEMTLVSGYFSLLIGEFYPDDNIFSYYSKRFNWSLAKVLDQAYSIHFIAGWKPWGNGVSEAHGKTTPELVKAFQEWEVNRQQVC